MEIPTLVVSDPPHGDEDEVDLGRGARNHIAFGYGAHRCVGAELARMELRIAYPALVRRFPAMRPAVEPSQLRFRRASIVFGLDKFFNVLTDWPQYLAGWMDDLMPGSAQDFMYAVGGIEVLAARALRRATQRMSDDVGPAS